MDEEYEKLLMEEQEQMAISILYDAGLLAIRSKNEEALKEVARLEQELLSVSSELATLSRFKGVSQQQCFTVKAESYRINAEKQKTKQLLRDVDVSISHWKDVRKKDEENAKNFNDLYESPWMIQKNELKEEVVKLHETLEEFEKELAKMESSKKYKSPRTSLDTETIQMFRNMVRSDLRLNPQRVAEEEPEEEVRPDLRFNSQRVAEEEPEEEEEEVHSDLHLNPQHVEEEEPEEEGDFFDQNSVDAIQLNVADEISPLHKLTPSPIRATPPDARPKPLHNYTPRNEDHLFKVPQPPHHAAPKNIVQTTDEDDMNNSLGLNTSDPVMDSQSGGPDFFNLLGNSSDNTGISFLQEHTNNSDTGGANFFFGGSSPRGQKDESSHGFLF